MRQRWTVLLLAVFLACSTESRAEMIAGNVGLNGLGEFTGTFDYTPTNSTLATLVVSLTNTSPGGSGYLTAFVFNNPQDLITGVGLVSSNANFSLLGSSPFQNGVNGAPYGQFDLGAGTGGSFEGGGAPSQGVAVGNSATFTFTLTGTGLDTLTAASFFSTLSVPPGQGEGPAAFVARFRGFDNDGSDKVKGFIVGDDDDLPIGPSQVPEPSALLLAGLGVGGSLSRWLWRRRYGKPVA